MKKLRDLKQQIEDDIKRLKGQEKNANGPLEAHIKNQLAELENELEKLKKLSQ